MSDNGGRTWRPARLCGDNRPSCWTAWELDWTPASPGPHELLVRATDTDGRTQPDVATDNDDGYLFGAVVRTRVDVG